MDELLPQRGDQPSPTALSQHWPFRERLSEPVVVAKEPTELGRGVLAAAA